MISRSTGCSSPPSFDTRVVGLIRAFLATSPFHLRRDNLDAAAFVIYQSVRATMLSRLLWSPPGLPDAAVVEELTDLVVRYLVDDAPSESASPSASSTRTSSAGGGATMRNDSPDHG